MSFDDVAISQSSVFKVCEGSAAGRQEPVKERWHNHEPH